jgi:iron(III) transport system substrate-binding protein
MKPATFFFVALLIIASPASAQPRKPSTIVELAVYRGPDREQILYAGAKTEGKIVWYTSLAGDSYKEMVKAFETKYPGVKVESYRAAGAELVTRLQEEGRARRNIADTIETTEGSLIFLRDEKLLRPYDSPHLDRYPEDGKERADKNTVYWALARESYIGLTYNKTLVSKDAVPKNFDGLLHPEVKGILGSSIGPSCV